MKRRFTLYVRQHQSGWFTAKVLALPNYAAHGPFPSELRDEIAQALKTDLSNGDLLIRGETHFDALVRKSVTVEVKAVQHQRLMTVPLRLSALYRKMSAHTQLYEVRIPRIETKFTIRGEENIIPWVEESIRGAFHLKEVTELLAYQYEKSERLDEVEVVFSRQPKKARIFRDVDEVIRKTHPLDGLGVELVGEAQNDRVGRALFRDPLMDELQGVLRSRANPSVLLVGSSGVGKTVLVHELAHRIHEGRTLAETEVWHIPGSRIIAGARYVGEWQERCSFVVEQIMRRRSIWYADGLLELLQSGVSSKQAGLDVASFILPYLRSGELSLIVEATPDALARAERMNAPFVQVLQRLRVPSLEISRTLDVMERSAQRLTKFRGVTWGDDAIAAALDVVARFGDADSLPGSGLAVLERMVGLCDPDSALDQKAAVHAFARMSGFPVSLVDPRALLDVDQIRRFFRDRVVGQDSATDLLSNVIMLLKAGLNDPAKPLGSFLFMGQTGVGKTECALALAEYLFGERKRLVRFDMSEFGHPGSSLCFVDGPNGEGALTKPVREQPFRVLLFDEVEKADPSVYDTLLQILGEGRLTDGTGRTVRFTHTIVIMTSNLGSADKEPIGFGEAKRVFSGHYIEAAERFFRPEFVNRIDHVVPFSSLSRENVARIARRLLDAAIGREGLERRGLRARYDQSVVDEVLRVGYDARYGARPMKRAVESVLTVPLARRLVNPDIPRWATLLKLSVVGGELHIEPSDPAGPK